MLKRENLPTALSLLFGLIAAVTMIVFVSNMNMDRQKIATMRFETGKAISDSYTDPTWYVVVGTEQTSSGLTIVAAHPEGCERCNRFPAVADSTLAWLRPGDKFLRNEVTVEYLDNTANPQFFLKVPTVEYVYGTALEEALIEEHKRTGT